MTSFHAFNFVFHMFTLKIEMTGVSYFSKAIFIVVGGSLEVVVPVKGEDICLGNLSHGHCFGDFGAVIAAKATGNIVVKESAYLIEIPIDAVDLVVFNLPFVVDNVHDIKAIARRRFEHV